MKRAKISKKELLKFKEEQKKKSICKVDDNFANEIRIMAMSKSFYANDEYRAEQSKKNGK